MTAAFTIILPHKRNPGNDAALRICLDCLLANTVNDFILLMDAAVDAPLNARVNRMVENAPTDCCVYWASDTFAAPSWDVPMLEAWNRDTIVTGVLVEPGAIATGGQNYHRDFGRRPETFRRAEFEAWVTSGEAPMLEGEGWYCPYMFSAGDWLAFGGMSWDYVHSADGFTGADITLFERWKAAGKRIVRARSWAYHLQRFSDPIEQTHPKRG